jgi:hypothetical protein
MSIGDYVAIAMLVWNAIVSLRGHKLTKKSIEQALFNNRQLIGQVIESALSAFAHTSAPASTASEPGKSPGSPTATAYPQSAMQAASSSQVSDGK